MKSDELVSLYSMETPWEMRSVEPRQDPFGILPTDLAIEILRWIPPPSLCSASRVCRKWNVLADSSQVWKFLCQMCHLEDRKKRSNITWKQVFKSHYKKNRPQGNSSMAPWPYNLFKNAADFVGLKYRGLGKGGAMRHRRVCRRDFGLDF